MDPARVVEMLRDGRFADVEALFAPPLRAVVSAAALRVGWESAAKGAVTSIGTPVSESGRFSVPVLCERGGFTVIMSVDGGLLSGLRLAPLQGTGWEPPSYADPEKFTECEVTVGDRGLPGTLTLPTHSGPGVVLLTPGPFDRDLTTGPNKPFKDLAWGLASRGIAVLRFDKVNYVHGDVATMVDEYVPDAVAAVRLLRQHVDRVFVLGHSGGGKAAPRVAEAEGSVAGLVVLAGDTVPLPRAAVRVARYLAELDPSPAAEAMLGAISRQAAATEVLAPDAELLFGWPASYWQDLRDYDPVATAAKLDRPMLILQGGRDYQVTVADDLARWRELSGPDVTIRVLDADDHMFFAGHGPSKPDDYVVPQHIDPTVVTSVADWVSGIPQAWAGYRSR